MITVDKSHWDRFNFTKTLQRKVADHFNASTRVGDGWGYDKIYQVYYRKLFGRQLILSCCISSVNDKVTVYLFDPNNLSIIQTYLDELDSHDATIELKLVDQDGGG